MSNDSIHILDGSLASTIGVPSNNTGNSQGSEPNKAAASEKECIDPDKTAGRMDVSKPDKTAGSGDSKKLLKVTTVEVAFVVVAVVLEILVVVILVVVIILAVVMPIQFHQLKQRIEYLENNPNGTGTAVEVKQQLEALQQNISDLNNRFSELQANYTKQEAQLQYFQTNQANQTLQNREGIETNANGFSSLDRKVVEQEKRLNSTIRDTGQKFETIQEATAEGFAALDGTVAELNSSIRNIGQKLETIQ